MSSAGRMNIEMSNGSRPQHDVREDASVQPDGAFAAPKEHDL
jgi:hypothetical protein